MSGWHVKFLLRLSCNSWRMQRFESNNTASLHKIKDNAAITQQNMPALQPHKLEAVEMTLKKTGISPDAGGARLAVLRARPSPFETLNTILHPPVFISNRASLQTLRWSQMAKSSPTSQTSILCMIFGEGRYDEWCTTKREHNCCSVTLQKASFAVIVMQTYMEHRRDGWYKHVAAL